MNATAQLTFLPEVPTRVRVLPKRTRDRDPKTSHEAAELNAANFDTQAELVLAAIKLSTTVSGRAPTAGEIADCLTHIVRPRREFLKWRYAVSRRTAELEKAGRIRKGAARDCSVMDTNQVTWELVR